MCDNQLISGHRFAEHLKHSDYTELRKTLMDAGILKFKKRPGRGLPQAAEGALWGTDARRTGWFPFRDVTRSGRVRGTGCFPFRDVTRSGRVRGTGCFPFRDVTRPGRVRGTGWFPFRDVTRSGRVRRNRSDNELGL